MNPQSKHLDLAQLADLAENRLAPEESAASLAHAESCSRCGPELARLGHIIGLMRTDAAEDAPRDVVASVLGLYRPRGAQGASGVARRILAALTFDSLRSAPAFGVRAAGTAPASRQLMFSAGERDVDLHIAPSGEAWVVSGQVLGDDLTCAGGEAELQGEPGAGRAALNDLCEFTLPAVPSGSYTLFLRLSDVEVEVPGLDLRA